LETGRPNLGADAPVEAYRLLQYSFRDVLERRLGTDAADEVFREAGELAGRNFAEHVLGPASDFGGFARRLAETFVQRKMGVVRIEEVADDASDLTLTVSEDLDCSGLPETGFGVCTYDEGFIAGLLGWFTGNFYRVRETACWCTGDRTCRFRAEVVR
jgi:predicted hydrocarbon binding protein